jgi:hypothetical protein
MSDAAEIGIELQNKVNAVREDEARMGIYSTGEYPAVALILDSAGYSTLKAVERVSPEWLEAARKVERWYCG